MLKDKREVKYLPFSNGEYWFNEDGVFSSNEGRVEVFSCKNSSELKVRIDWLGEKREYFLAELIMHTHLTTKLPVVLWKLLKVIYKNNDKTDLNIDNLVWKFPVGFGVSELNGFAYIPYFTRYAISPSAEVFDLVLKRSLKPNASRGYLTVNIKNDNGQRYVIKVHRLMMLAFSDYSSDFIDLQVNHKDGNKLNNFIDNLEWVNGSDNVRHAVSAGLSRVSKPVIVTNTITGEVKRFQTLIYACKFYGLRENKVSKLLGKPGGEYLLAPLVLRYEKEEHRNQLNPNKSPIIFRNIITGEIQECESIAECSRITGISKDVIVNRLYRNPNKLYSDFFQMKRKSDTTEWVEFNNPMLSLNQESWQKSVLARNVATKEVKRFKNQREAAVFFGISESIINKHLVKQSRLGFRSVVDKDIYNIIREKDFVAWEDINYQADLARDAFKRKVKVLDTLTGEEYLFDSAKACAAHFGLKETALNWRLKGGGEKTYPPGLKFKYHLS